MNTKKLIAAALVSVCASAAFAAGTPEVNFGNTVAPYEVTAQIQADSSNSVGSGIQSKNAGSGEQAMQKVNFFNTLEPSAVTAQPAAK